MKLLKVKKRKVKKTKYLAFDICYEYKDTEFVYIVELSEKDYVNLVKEKWKV